MAQIAEEVYRRAPRDPLAPAVQDSCSYTRAIDTVSSCYSLTCLIETDYCSDSTGRNIPAHRELTEGKESCLAHIKALYVSSVLNQHFACASMNVQFCVLNKPKFLHCSMVRVLKLLRASNHLT